MLTDFMKVTSIFRCNNNKNGTNQVGFAIVSQELCLWLVFVVHSLYFIHNDFTHIFQVYSTGIWAVISQCQ